MYVTKVTDKIYYTIGYKPKPFIDENILNGII
jgi:hypothetical protein